MHASSVLEGTEFGLIGTDWLAGGNRRARRNTALMHMLNNDKVSSSDARKPPQNDEEEEEEREEEEEEQSGENDVIPDSDQSGTDDDYFDRSGQRGHSQQQRDKLDDDDWKIIQTEAEKEEYDHASKDDEHYVAEPEKKKENPKEFRPDAVDPRLQRGNANCKVIPGQPGCNEKIMEALCSNKELVKEISEPLSCDSILTQKTTDRPWQTILAFICRPESVIDRLLVHWQLGSGKTIGMIRVLENFWNDIRPKMILFPTTKTKDNFLLELVEKPNQYLTAFKNDYPELDKQPLEIKAKKFEDWLQKTDKRGTKMKGPFASPVTLVSYNDAGKASGLSRGKGKNFTVTLPALIWNQNRKCTNVKSLDNAIIIADEAHYISDPSQAPDHHVKTATKRFKDEKWIQDAKNSVVVLLTATPLSGGLQNYMDIMTMLTKEKVTREGMEKGVTEGFALHMMSRDPNLFVKTSLDDPKLDSHGLPTVVSCPITGDALRSYVQTRFYNGHQVVGAPQDVGDRYTIKSPGQAAYVENVPLTVNKNPQKKFLEGYRHSDSWHDRKMTKVPTCNDPTKPQLEFISKYATKLDAVAKHISETNRKMLVFMQKSSGMRALRALVHKKYNVPDDRVYFIIPKNNDNQNDKRDNKIKRIIGEFNKQRDGEKDYRVLVLPAPEYQVSISFFGVREVDFVSLSNESKDKSSWDALNQQLGRAIRSCSHSYIDPNKTPNQWYDKGKDITKYIDFYLFVTTIGKAELQKVFPSMNSSYIDKISNACTLDETRFNLLVKDKKTIESEEDFVKTHSIVVDNVVEMARNKLKSAKV